MTPASTLVSITINLQRVSDLDPAPTLAEVASVVISKQSGSAPAVVVDTVTGPLTSATVTFTDTSPDFGENDTYSAVVLDIEGNTSAPGTFTVAVPASQLSAFIPPTVTAVFTPAA